MPRFVIVAVVLFWSAGGWAATKPSCADLLRTQPLNLLVAEIYSQPLDQENSFLLEFKTRESNIHRYVDDLKANFRKRGVKVSLQTVVPEGNESVVGVQASGSGKQLLLALIDLRDSNDLSRRRGEIVWVADPASPKSASVMRKPVPELNLPRPLVNRLLQNHIYFVGDLVSLGYRELIRFSGVGTVARDRIVAALEQIGLKPGTDVPDWPYPDIDPFDVTYPEGHMPQIPTWMLRDTQKRNIRSILSRSLKFTRPIIVLYNPEGAMNDPSGMIALIDNEFFTKKGPEEIVRYLESHAEEYTRRGISYDLVRKLATWKEKNIASYDTVSIEHLMSNDSPKWVTSVGESQTPLRMEVGDKTILVIPILPH
ncbi:MAG: hypothetical protein ACXVA9_03035 [Bdellovibrionales bacterium]